MRKKRSFMFSLKNILIFLAGAEFFHTLSHLLMPLFVELPLETKIIHLTPSLNIWAIIINALITLALLWWAKKIKS
jgi:hypothetical protein